jgi:hypothetical protein
MVIAIESSTSPSFKSAALVIAAESSASHHLQLAAYPLAVAIATAFLERSATIADIVASATIAGDAVEGTGTMSNQVAVSSFCPSCHIQERCWRGSNVCYISCNVYSNMPKLVKQNSIW